MDVNMKSISNDKIESTEELKFKVECYNRKLYRIVIIGCLSQFIGFCLYSYFNSYAFVFVAIPLYIIAMISLVLFYLLSNESKPLKIKFYKISKREEKMLKADGWEYFFFLALIYLYNITSIFKIIFSWG
ncbi:hypothetical protein C3432_11815 [Citrobacter amalonaticus]|uniref:Uncharacterized protein n=1 Tax=Citrobacter amalonaticus TaxID=35703 RepID=A0A2S4RRQ6_CITAM|nr:hypothetical protein [Citrobacter amalonaticus]POT58562.1 hypothetical protein C3432_11815 [Citrobacter amalonaticus]POT70300.1 hypothetical protein C3436_24515 [Citrobacter amalonaticus]POU61284.1 hypothetical protein C3430_23425 [Citrobacter amalonaticus]POV05147.1 hypothetical protein C3424_07305 [Citrobacter amalonaticus]